MAARRWCGGGCPVGRHGHEAEEREEGRGLLERELTREVERGKEKGARRRWGTLYR
jgi:hypothetical protein